MNKRVPIRAQIIHYPKVIGMYPMLELSLYRNYYFSLVPTDKSTRRRGADCRYFSNTANWLHPVTSIDPPSDRQMIIINPW